MIDSCRVGVIGGGAWGTALCILANGAGSTVTLGTRNGFVVQSILDKRSNDIYLPGVFVDPRSLRLIDGTVLDYDTNLVSKGFVFNNPNAKSTCGCGISFSA